MKMGYRQRGIIQSQHSLVTLAQQLNDAVVVVISLPITSKVEALLTQPSHHDVLTLSILAGALVLFIYPSAGTYQSWRTLPVRQESRALLRAWLTLLAVFMLIGFIGRPPFNYSVEFLVLWGIVGGGLQLATHFCVRQVLHFMRRLGRNTRTVLIIGATELGCRVAGQIERRREFGLRLLGFVDDETKSRTSDLEGKIIGALKDCKEICTNRIVDHIYLCLPLEKNGTFEEILCQLENVSAEIHWVPDIHSLKLMNHRVSCVGDMPVLTLTASPFSNLDQMLKSVMDKALASVILILLSPLMLFIALLIKLTSPGPIFFVQERHGINGRVFGCLKFRTMYLHREERGKLTQAREGDPRITPIGAFIRKTSLDELPQLLNVLKGDMSLVGPRPHACAHNEEYKGEISRYMCRHLVKPGITGWAQVNGYRGETERLEKMESRIEHDLYYIRNWSIWLDLKILLLTPLKGLWNKNAH